MRRARGGVSMLLTVAAWRRTCCDAATVFQMKHGECGICRGVAGRKSRWCFRRVSAAGLAPQPFLESGPHVSGPVQVLRLVPPSILVLDPTVRVRLRVA
jgi:hypothetical protein